MNEIDRRKVMPGKYYDIFKSRIINAQHGRHGDVEKAVMEFYRDFKKKVPNDGFTPENLLDLAEKIAGGEISGSHFVPGAGYGSNGFREIDAIGGDSDAFNRSYSGRFNEGRVRVTESQLCNLIKESVKKALMNEISSDMIGRARDKFIQKYGNNFMGQETAGEMDQSLEKDTFNRKLHPKDKKPLAWHQAGFNRAYGERYLEEHPEIIEKAKQLADTIEPGDWEDLEMTDHYEHGYGSVCGVAVVTDENGKEWEFSCYGDGHYEGGWLELDNIEGIQFTTPEGVTGEI